MALPPKFFDCSETVWYVMFAVAVAVPYVGGFLTAVFLRWLIAG